MMMMRNTKNRVLGPHCWMENKWQCVIYECTHLLSFFFFSVVIAPLFIGSSLSVLAQLLWACSFALDTRGHDMVAIIRADAGHDLTKKRQFWVYRLTIHTGTLFGWDWNSIKKLIPPLVSKTENVSFKWIGQVINLKLFLSQKIFFVVDFG